MTDAGKKSERSEYDVVVIGAGPVGENVADRARAAGLSTAVVESELVGGECSYWACMPSKALLRPVVARADARRVPGLSAAVRGPLDVEAVLAHRDAEASHWQDDGQVAWLESVGAAVHRGTGRLTGPRAVALTSPDGNALLEMNSAAVAAWVERTLRVVPPGSESDRLGIDEALAELLAPLPADDLWLSDPWQSDDAPSQDGEA